MTIADATRKFVRRRANYICEYCHSPERICTTRFTLDYLIPKSLGGSDDNTVQLRRCAPQPPFLRGACSPLAIAYSLKEAATSLNERARIA